MKTTNMILALILSSVLGCVFNQIATAEPPANLIEVKSMDDWNLLELNKKDTDFLFFYSENCHWCEKEAPLIEKLATKYTEITFIRINSTKFKSIGKQHKVRSYPTMIFGGKKYIGFQSYNSLDQRIQTLITKKKKKLF